MKKMIMICSLRLILHFSHTSESYMSQNAREINNFSKLFIDHGAEVTLFLINGIIYISHTNF